MNLEELKKHIRTVQEFEWRGNKVHFRKLNAEDHIALFGDLKPAENAADDKKKTADFHVELVARSWANADGELQANSEDGRALLRSMGFHELVELGELALQYNGYEAEKKSSAEPTCSPSDSAEILDPRSSTPTTSCPA